MRRGALIASGLALTGTLLTGCGGIPEFPLAAADNTPSTGTRPAVTCADAEYWEHAARTVEAESRDQFSGNTRVLFTARAATWASYAVLATLRATAAGETCTLTSSAP